MLYFNFMNNLIQIIRSIDEKLILQAREVNQI